MTTQDHFRVRLQLRQQQLQSALCVGLDPDLDKMPPQFRRQGFHERLNVLAWMKDVVDKTAPFASMFKPQRAYYEAIDNGERTLRELIAYIREKYPDIPIFTDAKRGDIDRTQQRYRKALFDIDGTDGTNVSCYMGSTPFLNMFDARYPYRAVVNLIYTSNPAAREFQDAIMADGNPVWLFMAELTLRWIAECGAHNAGFVMAAAYEKDGAVFSTHLHRCRQLDKGSVWYLIPGFGTQKGYMEETVATAWKGYGSIAMNASSSINNAANPAEEAEKLHLVIREAIKSVA